MMSCMGNTAASHHLIIQQQLINGRGCVCFSAVARARWLASKLIWSACIQNKARGESAMLDRGVSGDSYLSQRMNLWGVLKFIMGWLINQKEWVKLSGNACVIVELLVHLLWHEATMCIYCCPVVCMCKMFWISLCTTPSLIEDDKTHHKMTHVQMHLPIANPCYVL